MIELPYQDYNLISNILENVPINTLFAKSVVNHTKFGQIYVDKITTPSSFYIRNPCGMSLLFGRTDNEEFNNALFDYMTNKSKVREEDEWLQVFPNTWKNVIENALGSQLIRKQNTLLGNQNNNKIKENLRVNFRFSSGNQNYLSLIRNDLQIVRTTEDIFLNLHGNVAPKDFWNNVDQFFDQGVGFSLVVNGEIASTAFSSFCSDNQLEIGIETSEKYRGKGYAQNVCAALIQYCVANGLEPVWSCREENIASYQLAQKLGFVPTIYIPYYRLAKN
jgi:GNAT superfamily N-acetyltransferase